MIKHWATKGLTAIAYMGTALAFVAESAFAPA